MRRLIRYLSALLIFIVACAVNAHAQFKEKAFTQTYNDTSVRTSAADTSDKLFSFKELFGGLAHKQDLRIGTMLGGSIFMPGASQIYNRQYWKLPIIYGSLGALAGTGGYYLHRYNVSKKNYEAALANIPEFATDVNISPGIDYRAKQTGTWLLVGAGIVYWATLLDGAINYKPTEHPHPGRATVYSLLLPGLGQAYNGEYWKIPIYWGCLIGSAHFLYTNNVNYQRFKRIYTESYQEGYNGPVTQSQAQYYRDVYRRYRDYSVVALVGFYLLQVIDANVFAYMHDFEVSDDISMRVEPAVIAPDNAYAMNVGENAIGFRIGLRF